MAAHAHDCIRNPGLAGAVGRSRASGCPSATSTGSSWPGSYGVPLALPASSWRRRGDRVGVAEAHRVPVADPQGLQADLVAAAGGRRDRGLAGHRRHRRRVHRGVAARLAPGPAVPGRGLVAAGHRGVAGLPGDPGARLPRRPRPPPDVGGRLGPPDHRPPGGRVRRAGPGRPPGRAGPGRPGVGVAELRHHRRARRHDGLGADHLRRPPVEPAGPHRPGPHPRPRRGPAAGPRRTRSRSAAPSAPSATPGTPCSPSSLARAPGTWSSSARPAAGRRT